MMSIRPATLAIVLAALAATVSLVAPARSEPAEEFYKGKQIALIIGYNPGGTYDIYARLAATLLPKYIPGHPRIVAQNMPGVGSAKAANYLFQQGSRDGLTLGVIGQQLPVSQALRTTRSASSFSSAISLCSRNPSSRESGLMVSASAW